MAGIILNQLHESPTAGQREAAEQLGCYAMASEAWSGNVESCPSGAEAGGFNHWPDMLHKHFDCAILLTAQVTGNVTRRAVRLFLDGGDPVYFVDTDGNAYRIVNMDKNGNIELESE